MPVKYYVDATKKYVVDDLFTKTAENYVKDFQEERIKSAQIRKFYHEALLIESRILDADSQEDEFLAQRPYINMMKAKATYAKSRNHVGDKFVSFIENNLIQTVKDFKDYRVFCDLFEAIIAYYSK